LGAGPTQILTYEAVSTLAVTEVGVHRALEFIEEVESEEEHPDCDDDAHEAHPLNPLGFFLDPLPQLNGLLSHLSRLLQFVLGFVTLGRLLTNLGIFRNGVDFRLLYHSDLLHADH
jgi:hypothetical protein